MTIPDFGKVGVILGGTSSEREISLKSGRAIAAALRESGVEVVEIGEAGEITSAIAAAGIDRAFIALHGHFGEDGTIQEFLADHRIPHTGSDAAASRLAFDKAASRRRFEAAGLNVPSWREYRSGGRVPAPDFFPVVVKPCREGSSIGLSVVTSAEDFAAACDLAGRYDERFIVESFIAGPELTVGILGDTPLPVVEIVPAAGHFDYDNKYVKGRTEFIVPARLEEQIALRLREDALRAHRSLGCRHYSRVDIILGSDGIPRVLELNTIPGFTGNSLYPMAARAAGIEFQQLCLELLSFTLK